MLASASVPALALIALPSAAHAQNQDRYWDANGALPGSGGNGTWNTTDPLWSESNSDVLGPYRPWNNAGLDNAIFGLTAGGTTTTAGTITLTSPITVHDLTFRTVNNWVLDGGTLTLAGTAPTITTNGNTTINSVIAGTAGLTKAGGSQLYLTGTNTFSGTIFLNGGSLRVDDDAALGALGNTITTGAATSVTLVVETGGTNRAITIGDGGTLSLGGGAGSALISGNGRVVMGTGTTLSNDANSYTGSTTFNGCNGVCSTYFTSIGNLGEASALGAPTNAADGTIVFNQSSQYSDSVIYLGDGDSSNRNWDLNGGAANIRNQGTGTLSITGDVDTNGGATFSAEGADFELLGTLSGVNFSFSGTAGRTITLGGANTYTGVTGIGTITARASVLSDTGVASSFGLGTSGGITIQGNGALSYTGTGDSSDRAWTIGNTTAASASGSILNDGSGALTLTGTVTFGGAANNNFTLGGSFAGTNILSGVISGNGNFVSTGAGTWLLSGANTRTGTITVNGGTLQAGDAAAFGTTTGTIVNGGTLDLDGFDLATPTLNGTGGTIDTGAGGTLIVNGTAASLYAGTIAGAGNLSKLGTGTLTLTGANGYTGATRIGGGTLALDFSGAGGPAGNIISSASTLDMSGGALQVIGAAGEANSQSFAGFNVLAGSNTIGAQSGTGGSVTIDLGAINRSGGVVNFVLPATGSITTANADGLLGGWATVNGSDYAKVVGGAVVAFEATDYTDEDDASLWASGQIISDDDGDADSFFGTLASDVQLGGLRFTVPDATTTVTIAPGHVLGIDGTIIVAPSVGANDQTITGGFLTGGAGGGTLGVQQNGGGIFTIGSTITNNGGATSFVKGGSGTVRLTGANDYAGGTTLSGGRLEVSTLADGGVASSIGASSAVSSNLVLESGTLAYIGGADAVTDRGFTLVNGGAGTPTIEVNAGRGVEFSGLVTSPDDAGLTKTGWGTLVLSNAGNDYVGVTTISGSGAGGVSTISVNTLADGGVASGIGAADSASANLVLADGGRLQYTGGDVAIDRGFTLSNGGRIDVSEVATTLTVGGDAIGSGPFVKEGDGTLILAGTNSYSGGTRVDAGTLRAGSTRAFGGGAGGTGAGAMTVAAGATLDLADFDNFVGGLNGAGTVTLGTATLNINSGGTFTGTVSGTGGIAVTRFTQIMTGCNNDYTGPTTISSGISTDCLADGGQASGIGASTSDASNLVFANGTLNYTGGSVSIDRGFTVASGRATINVTDAATTLEFSGASAGNQLAKDGAGTLVLSGTTTRTGATLVNEGTLRAGTTNAFGTGGVSFANVAGATLDLAGFDTTIAWLDVGGTTGGNVLLGDATLTLSAGSNAVYGGAISGTGNIVKTGSGLQTFAGCASSYSGTTTVTAGVLAVNCLADGGVASSIGTSSADAGNLVLNGGVLRYVGTGGSTDRQFTLGAAAGSALDASGTGAIAFTYGGPVAFNAPDLARTLTLTGTSSADNSLAAQITNNGTGTTSLTKTGTGTWILRNANSDYTGVTTISGGVLGVDVLADGGQASSIGASSNAAANLVIGSGATLRYTGDGDTTDRRFTLAVGTTAIESSGAGAVAFTNTAAVSYAGNGQRVVSLGGTNAGDNIMGAAIGNQNAANITSLAKNGAGRWILTGDNLYTGATNINAGTLILGNGGTTGSIASQTVNNFGLLGFDRSDSYVYGGVISQTGAVQQLGSGTTILTGTNSYTGGTTILAGTLQLGNGGATGSIVGNVANDGVLAFNRSNLFTFGGVISGGGQVVQAGAGTTVLTATNLYTGGTAIDAGTLQIAADANLGAASGALSFDGGTLRTTADIASARATTLAGAGTFQTDADTSFTLGGTVSGGGSLTKSGDGTLILTADNAYDGGTTIAAGRLQLGDGGATGAITGDVANDGVLAFNRAGSLGFDGLISGNGALVQDGPGTVILTAANSYAGATTINAGTLRINGDQSAATGLVTVNNGATLGGAGTIGGDVVVNGGGTLAPGNSPGTLTINGDLSLAGGSILQFEFGEADVAGGPLNDLVNVGGDLVLDGTINVTEPTGGNFSGGIYRVFNYGGTLTDNGLELGAMPAGSDVTVQTSVAGQINLVNSAGLSLSFWDGDAGPKFNDTIDGGNGTWHLGGTDNNWTDAGGSVNAAYADGSFAVFAGAGGTVGVDNGDGAVTASDLQFASDGYTITGDALTLAGGAQSVVRVGDGSAAGEGFAATIAAELAGATQLVKTDAGTLILTGANSYTGGTLIDAGTLQVGNGGTTGSILGDIVDNGTLAFNRSDLVTFDGAVSGTGRLIQAGAGTLVLTGDSNYTGGTLVAGGTLRISSDANLGDVAGALSLQGGVLQAGASFVSARNILVGSPNSNSIDTQAFDVTLGGAIADGPDNATGNFLNKLGSGTLTLTGANTYSNRTVIAGGTLALAGTGTIGAGNLVVGSGTTFDISQTDTGARVIQLNGAADGTVALGSRTLTLGFSNSFTDWAGTIVDGGIGGGTGGKVVISAFGGAVRYFNTTSYTGGTTVAAGSFELVGGGALYSGGAVTVDAGASFSIAGLTAAGTTIGDLSGGGTVALGAKSLTFGTANSTLFSGTITGAGGSLEKTGTGTFTLTGANSYTGETTVGAGTLLVNGDQSAATGATSVLAGATLGGTGVIGGDVDVQGRLSPGSADSLPGTLTINGGLTLGAGAQLDYDFGQANVAGGAFNDLIEVGGDLALGGTLNVTVSAGDSLAPGIYRVLNYGGALSGGSLVLGDVPADTDFFVQTSVAGQVNLVNANGLALRFWDGAAGARNDGFITGGDGVWQNDAGNDNWTLDDATINAPYLDSAFAVFGGTGGTVTVDRGLGAVRAGGMQFAADNYVVTGDSIDLVGSQATIRVGDGTALGAGYVATIDAALNGTAQLVKADLGTLVLTGVNGYTGGTAVDGGVLQISADSNLGDAAGGLSFDGGTLRTTDDVASARAVDLVGDGALAPDAGTTLSLTGAVTGAGGLTQSGDGTVILSGANAYAGATNVNAGTLIVDGDQSAATGVTNVAAGATLGGAGTIGGDVAIAAGATLDPGGADGLPGTLAINGGLALDAGSTLAMQFGEANVVGGALNDLIEVGGDLVLDGTLNVAVPAGGSFDAGIYRVINYGGTLTDNGLELGALPGGGTAIVQTSIAGQVNLVNTAGLALNFWDGAAGPKSNGAVDGGDGVWQSGAGNDNWTDAAGAVNAGFADGAFAIFAGTGGDVAIDNSLGAVSAAGLQFAADGYAIGGDALTLTGPQSIVRVGDGTDAGAGFTATLSADLTGDTQLVKTDAGTLILGGANSYGGGTLITGGTVRIADDTNLGAADGAVTLDGGTLATSADVTSARDIVLAGVGAISTASGTTFTFDGLLSGTGALTKAGVGTLVLTADNGAYASNVTLAAGTLAVDGVLGGLVNVGAGARLEGTGQVGGIANDGVVAPGRSIGTLTVAGDYAGNNGTLEIEAVLGDDSSPADRLVVSGATSGTTRVTVINRDGLGAQTVDGIKIVDVAGASNGTFTLSGDYLFEGAPAVIAGAYGYRLFQGGVVTPGDGDWYLRSTLLDPGDPAPSDQPLYQPGVPLYESYAATLQTLNGLPTLQERVGNRHWSGFTASGIGLWGRVEGARLRPEAAVSTSGADIDTNIWQMQVGLDAALADADAGVLIAGVNARYGTADARVRSLFGNGTIDTKGYSLGATLTWYGHGGFYADAQAQTSWYDSDLDSGVLGDLADGNDGSGEAFSLEIGQRLPIGGSLSLTPQAQLVYSNVRFDRFVDPNGAAVSSGDADSLRGRLGLALDHQLSWRQRNGATARSHLYGFANLDYEMLDGTRADVSGTPLLRRDDRLWGELGVGGSYSWDDGRYTLYSEVSANTALSNFGDSNTIRANAGLRISF